MLTRQGEEKDGSWHHWCSQWAVKEGDSQVPVKCRYKKIGEDIVDINVT